MAKYKEHKTLSLPEIDKEIRAFWEKENIFQRSIDERPEDNTYVFYEGPPSANGKPGIHHVMARTVKDIFCRFHTMQGQRVLRKGGWDTHGLPIELSVEKELGITKEDIGKSISVDEYNQKCRETVMRYKHIWDDLTVKMGYWVDLENPYITFENNYIESVWWLLEQLHKKGLLYKGYTIQPFSPAAGTGLSTHELNQPGCYKDVKDTSAVAQFKVVKNAQSEFLFEGNKDGDVFFIAWTTTPWTLPSNTALAVGAKIDYVRIATYNPYTKLPVNLIMAKDLVGKWFKPAQAEADYDSYTPDQKVIPYVVTGEYKGASFNMLEYEQLMPYVQPEEGDAFKVLLGDFVSTSDGTGIVHLAPSFGADDMRVAKQNGIGALTLVDKQGKFVDEVTDFAGRYVKDYKDEGDDYRNVDVDISIMLKERNRAFNVQKYSHNYPHCWRTDKPVLYYPLDSWFVRTTAAKDRLIELNNTINWKPAHTGEKRFGNWLENLQDWNLSRSRYWGIPLPIWRTEDASDELCIGSVEELKTEIEKANKALGLNQEVPADLHRPYIDDVVLVSDNGQPMKRELDLIDVWFDSGSMPYAQHHYPFENKNMMAEGRFPADFIAEGVDQTRGWFFTLHAIAGMVFDSVAYKNVVSNGLVLDKNGVKMSKRLGNAIDPFETLEKYGVDATRWYMISNASPWDNLKFDLAGVEEVTRKFFSTMFQTFKFFGLYANIDQFTHAEAQIPLADRQEIDRWIISLLNTLQKEVEQDFANYEPTQAARKIQSFADDHLSNWYVRLCRRRFWKGEYTTDKIAAYQTLYQCLSTLSKMMAPIAPYFSDWLYKNLNDVSGLENHPSVHLADFPKGDDAAIDAKLEQRMDYAQRISSLVLSLRKKDSLRVRQPLKRVLLPVLDADFQSQVDALKDLILAEVNVKDIEYITDTTGIIKKKAKANFKTLGRKLGKDMKAAAALIQEFDNDKIAEIEKTNHFELDLGEVKYELSLEDLDIMSEDIPGWQVATDRDITVALDIQLDDDLIAEGAARELVNRIQGLRKSNNFEVTDRISVEVSELALVTAAVEKYADYIKAEVLADSITVSSDIAGEKVEWLDEQEIQVKVSKV